MSAFADFMRAHELTSEELVGASMEIEQDMNPRRREREPRSSGVLTRRAVELARGNWPLSPRVRERVLRAVNHLLRRRSAAEVTMRELFGTEHPTRRRARSR